ncbi:glycosyltransferase family 9 protein [uncultured Fusobacterium sp.]|uniref:glycosyltransferase family 9 protein n=1 Tax=uncultured Fusobacterium sp. TaxID=159267 RepID=UPI002590AD56|nr:glycosyltransferase family 9 protein [uncultured Fusobacterium sp.]
MEISRIIVSRTDKIGDLILSIPSFYMIKKMYPQAELIVLVRKYNYEIVKNLPYVDRIVKIDDFTHKELIDKIKYFNADIFVALYNDSFVSQLARASKAKFRIGPLSKLCSFLTYNKGVWQKRSKSIKNEAEYNLDLVKKIDPELFDKTFEINTSIYLGPENRVAAATFFSNYNIKDKVLVVNPFMGGSAKNIKDEQYASLLKEFTLRNPDKSVIIVTHISEEERGLNLINMTESNNVHLFANGGDLLNIGAIIDRGTVYLGPSTGPTHIAGALKKRIVAIYPAKATQSTTRWGVFGNNKVKYLVPDINNPNENYKNPYFDTYDKDMENELLKYLEESFEAEEGGKN